MRLLAPLLMLIALLLGQSHGFIAHGDTLVHRHRVGQAHPTVADPHGKNDHRTGEHSHEISSHPDQGQPTTVVAAFHLEFPAILSTGFTVPDSAEPSVPRSIYAFVGVHHANAPPLERPSRAPPVPFA